MTELPDEMKTTLTNLDTSLTALEEHLDPIFEIPWDVLTARLEPMEKAKLNLMMAYSTASLFYMYLKSQVIFLIASLISPIYSKFLNLDQGISTEDHPVQSELARIHSYIGKLKEVTGRPLGVANFLLFESLGDLMSYRKR